MVRSLAQLLVVLRATSDPSAPLSPLQLSAIFLINQKGEIIIYRLYRDDVSLAASNTFRLQVIAAKEAGSAAPVRLSASVARALRVD